MLWPKNAPEGARDGTGYIEVSPTNTTAKDGWWVKYNGVHAAAAGPSGRAGGPGYASSGDKRWSLALSGDTNAGPVYPVKRYQFQREDSDLSLDVLTSGEAVVVFKSGQFETDQYTGITDTLAVGTLLYLDGTNSYLTTGATGTHKNAVAVFLGKSLATAPPYVVSFDSNYTATGMVWFEMLPVPLAI